MANVYKGVGIQWGVSGSAATAFGSFKLQSRDHAGKADKDEVRNAEGNVEQVTYYNPTQTATFTYVPTGATGASNITPTIPDIGSVVTITDNNGYNQVTGSYLVDDWSTQGSNTSALRVTVNLTKYPLITS